MRVRAGQPADTRERTAAAYDVHTPRRNTGQPQRAPEGVPAPGVAALVGPGGEGGRAEVVKAEGELRAGTGKKGL